MRRAVPALSIATALVLSACAGDAEVDDGASPSATATATATATTTVTETETATETATETEEALTFTPCEADGYTIGYPAGWETNEPDRYASACTVFHPGEVDTPDQPQDLGLHWAVTAYTDEVEYERVSEADVRNEELHREELTVDGRDAHVREYESTGDALLPEGEREYRYVIDLDGAILVVSTTTVGDTDYERDKRVIDRMVREELRFDG